MARDLPFLPSPNASGSWPTFSLDLGDRVSIDSGNSPRAESGESIVPIATVNRQPIFISYRRDDSSGHAGRLRADLVRRYGESQIFLDLSIEPGVDFVTAIEEAVGSCAVLLAVVGRYWLTVTDEKTSKRRLDNPNDYVRIEIATALQRNIRVIPLLVNRATMPHDDELPDNLKPLARRNALEITDQRWDYDVGNLEAVLDKIVGFTG